MKYLQEECEHDINVQHNCVEYYERCNKCGKEWVYKDQKELKEIWGITQ